MYVRKRADEMVFTDDLMFRYVMRDPQRCRMVLERVVGLENIGRIEVLDTQRSAMADIDARGIRLDVYMRDSEKVYTVEMQTTREPFLGKRFRYYESVMDVELLDAGQGYRQLREQIIVFFCTYQPFEGYGRCRYEFQTRCVEEPGLALGDGVRKIVICSRGDFSEESEDVQAFLRYMNGEVSDNRLVEVLDAAVHRGRASREVRRDAMILSQVIDSIVDEKKDEWLEEGIEQGAERFGALAERLLKDSREAELMKAAKDKSVRDSLYEEYGI